ncbi:hypothetical protein GP486_006234, partial [Trichoglossum hirsutum]
MDFQSAGSFHGSSETRNGTASLRGPPPGADYTIIVQQRNGRPEVIYVRSQNVSTYSARLRREIEEGRRFKKKEIYLPVEGLIIPEILATIIKTADRKKERNTTRDFGCRELLYLSIALWEYEFSIQLFEKVAKIVREEYWLRSYTKYPEAWTFIALVFGWEDHFRAASAEAICVYGTDPGIYEQYLPKELNQGIELRDFAVREKRISAMSEIYTNIHRAWVALFTKDQCFMNWIASRLMKTKISIAEPESRYLLQQMCPRILLKTLTSILNNTHPPQSPQEGQPIPQLDEPEQVDDTTSTTSPTSLSSPNPSIAPTTTPEGTPKQNPKLSQRGSGPGSRVSVHKLAQSAKD